MTMNIFRLSGDMLHLASILILLLKIRVSKSCAGVSLKTQELYFIVFVCRYGTKERRIVSFHVCTSFAGNSTPNHGHDFQRRMYSRSRCMRPFVRIGNAADAGFGLLCCGSRFFVTHARVRSGDDGIIICTYVYALYIYTHRYLDLFIRFIGLYNFTMKIFYIGSAAAIVYYMRFHKVRNHTLTDRDECTRI